MRGLVAVLVVMADAGSAPECRADADCVITQFAGCCGACCEPKPYAISKAGLAGRQRLCAAASCGPLRCYENECELFLETFRAECRNARCQAVEVPPKKNCKTDGDCRLEWISTDAGCVVRSLPAKSARPTPAVCAPASAASKASAVCGYDGCVLVKPYDFVVDDEPPPPRR